nr:small nuclear ribonucleoprotein D1 [Cryptomonas sp.]
MKIRLIFEKITNEIITVELKNGVTIHGRIFSSDKYMNIYLKKAKRSVIPELPLNIESISIRGNMIRYIILPIWINFDSILFFPEVECYKTKQNYILN